MFIRTSFIFVFFVICILYSNRSVCKNIKNKQYRYTISIPEQLIQVPDSGNLGIGEMYLDTTLHIVLEVFKSKSRFKSIKEYLDCSKQDLELELRKSYNDSELRLVSCIKSVNYPEKIIILNIEISVIPAGYNQSIIYFIHHNSYDIQFTFLFRREIANKILTYTNNIMKTLQLY